MSAVAETLWPSQRVGDASGLTIEEFETRYVGERVEVIDGVIVELPMPGFEHGKFCYKLARWLGGWIEDHDLGHLATNDSFVQLRADPLLIRGPDFQFISYERLPRSESPKGVLRVPPELVAEVRSPTDSWNEMLIKAEQYLAAGVSVVLLLDPPSLSISILARDRSPKTFDQHAILELPDILPGFSIPVSKLFA